MPDRQEIRDLVVQVLGLYSSDDEALQSEETTLSELGFWENGYSELTGDLNERMLASYPGCGGVTLSAVRDCGSIGDLIDLALSGVSQ